VSARENLEVQRRARANQRTDGHEYGDDNRHRRLRLFESDENLNESVRTGFLVGTAKINRSKFYKICARLIRT
jgi:hypothetical protein